MFRCLAYCLIIKLLYKFFGYLKGFSSLKNSYPFNYQKKDCIQNSFVTCSLLAYIR